MSEYNIYKTNRKIIINKKDKTQNSYGNKLKEEITLRKASRDLLCYECKETIKKGNKYIRDKHYYLYQDSWFNDILKKVVRFICLDCWKGEIPKEVNINKNMDRNTL